MMKTREQMIQDADLWLAVRTMSNDTPWEDKIRRVTNHDLADFALEQIEEAIAAERSRIVAALEAKLIKSSLPDAYEEGFDDGLAKAIEIVKGGDDDER